MTAASVNICPPRVSLKESHHFLSFYMEGNQTRFVGFCDSDIKNLVTNAVTESTTSTKYAVNVFDSEVTSRLLKFSPIQM